MSESPQKILFFVPRPFIGGEATAFSALAKHLVASGKYEVLVLLAHPFQEDELAIDKRYIKGYAYERRIENKLLYRMCNFINLLTNYYFYIKFAKRIAHDIFVVYSAPDFSYWIKYSEQPTLGWLHFMPQPIPPRWPDKLRSWFSRGNLRKFSSLVAITEEVGGAWFAQAGLKQRPTVVLNVVDVDRIVCLGDEPQREISAEGVNVICVGRVSFEKGIDRLIAVALQLHKHGLRFKLWIVGDGPQLPKCRSLAEVDSDIVFLGAKGNPYPYMKAADLLVLPSRSEGYGLVLIEAMILGTSVMATRSGGTVAALGNGMLGILVENSQEGLLAGMKEWLLHGRTRTDASQAIQSVLAQNKHSLQLFSELRC